VLRAAAGQGAATTATPSSCVRRGVGASSCSLPADWSVHELVCSDESVARQRAMRRSNGSSAKTSASSGDGHAQVETPEPRAHHLRISTERPRSMVSGSWNSLGSDGWRTGCVSSCGRSSGRPRRATELRSLTSTPARPRPGSGRAATSWRLRGAVPPGVTAAQSSTLQASPTGTEVRSAGSRLAVLEDQQCAS
jgi:hypothetical protein